MSLALFTHLVGGSCDTPPPSLLPIHPSTNQYLLSITFRNKMLQLKKKKCTLQGLTGLSNDKFLTRKWSLQDQEFYIGVWNIKQPPQSGCFLVTCSSGVLCPTLINLFCLGWFIKVVLFSCNVCVLLSLCSPCVCRHPWRSEEDIGSP